MAPRARTTRLQILGPSTTHFRRRSGKVTHYNEYLFFNDGRRFVFGWGEENVTRPFVVADETIFDKQFKGFRVQRKGETYTTIAVFSMDGRPLGIYSDTTLPFTGVRRGSTRDGPGFEADIDDLYLDHWIFPDGRRVVLDLDELHQGQRAGTISTQEAALSLETVSWIEDQARRGLYPRRVLGTIRLDPDLLDGLPSSQEQA